MVECFVFLRPLGLRLAKGGQLLDEAGWKLNENTGFREKDGNELKLNFTTTNATFRQT